MWYIKRRRQGYRRRYSGCLRAGMSGDLIHPGRELPCRPKRHQNPTTLLYKVYQVFLVCKAAVALVLNTHAHIVSGCEKDGAVPPPPFCAFIGMSLPLHKTQLKSYFRLSLLAILWTTEKTGCAVALWLRHYATNRQVAGSIPDGVIGIFQ